MSIPHIENGIGDKMKAGSAGLLHVVEKLTLVAFPYKKLSFFLHLGPIISLSMYLVY